MTARRQYDKTKPGEVTVQTRNRISKKKKSAKRTLVAVPEKKKGRAGRPPIFTACTAWETSQKSRNPFKVKKGKEMADKQVGRHGESSKGVKATVQPKWNPAPRKKKKKNVNHQPRY